MRSNGEILLSECIVRDNSFQTGGGIVSSVGASSGALSIVEFKISDPGHVVAGAAFPVATASVGQGA